MSIKGALLVVIPVALMDGVTLSIYRGRAPTGFLPCEPLLQFRNPEDTGLLWMYVLYTPHRPKKLTHADKLFGTCALIVMLLIISGIESHLVRFINIFLISSVLSVKTPHSGHSSKKNHYLIIWIKGLRCNK